MDYSNPALNEVHSIVQTVEVVVAGRPFRLEVVQCLKGAKDQDYGIRYYEGQTVYKAKDGTISAECTSLAVPFTVWVPDRNLAPVASSKADWALEKGLENVATYRNNQNSRL
jgi:hypothetical protein